jgi:hypothetical protein
MPKKGGLWVEVETGLAKVIKKLKKQRSRYISSKPLGTWNSESLVITEPRFLHSEIHTETWYLLHIIPFRLSTPGLI